MSGYGWSLGGAEPSSMNNGAAPANFPPLIPGSAPANFPPLVQGGAPPSYQPVTQGVAPPNYASVVQGSAPINYSSVVPSGYPSVQGYPSVAQGGYPPMGQGGYPSVAQRVYPSNYPSVAQGRSPPMGQGGYAGTWVPSSGSYRPQGAISAGRDLDGSEIIAGRANHEGDLLPAKVIPSHGVAYVSYGGEEHAKHQYEVLTEVYSAIWRPSQNGNVPSQAVICGKTGEGETLYMGRAHYNGTITPGKVHPSHGVLYIPFGGKEISIKNYEVLCSA